MTTADQDLMKLFAGIEYLAHIDGEKHLVFLNEGGMDAGSADDERELGERAADARVAIDYVQTGGAAGVNPYATNVNAALSDAYPGFHIAALERVADMSGGTGSFYSYATDGFDAIDRATRAGYLLGYASPGTTNGRLRKIEVAVDRPGVTLEYRHSYFATPEPALTDRQLHAYQAILGSLGKTRRDFPVTATVDDWGGEPPSIDVRLTLDSSTIEFDSMGGHKVAALDVAIFTGESVLTNNSWHTVNVPWPESKSGARKSREVSFTLHVPLPQKPKLVLAVVYEYGANLLASVWARRAR